MVLPYINMNLPQVYTCSPSWTVLTPPSPYHPFGSSQCTSPMQPVLCIEPGLATRFIYDIILKSKDFTLPTKVRLVKAMVFLEVMYGCESWTMKKAEHWRIYTFVLWGWKRLSRVPWTARRSNQSVLREISPKYSLEGLMLKLKRQYFGHLMRRTDSFEKTLMLGKIEGSRRRGQ